MKLQIILAAFLMSYSLIGQIDSTLTSNPTEAYVFSFSGLNLRAQPSTDAFVRAKLVHGTSVSVQRVSTQLDTIDHRIGRWVEVKADGRKGYLFDGFLSEHEPPYIQYAYQACDGTGYVEEWIQDHLNDSPMETEDYTVTNNDANYHHCKESSSTVNFAGEKYEEIISENSKSIIFTSTELNMNDVYNLLDYLAASANKYCGIDQYPSIVPYRTRSGEIYKVRYSHPHAITAITEDGALTLEMKISI